MRIVFLASGLVMAAVACGGTTAGDSPDGAAPDASRDAGGSQADAQADAREDDAADTSVNDVQAVDTGVVSACPPTDKAPVAQATAHLVITNATQEDRYVVTGGQFCDAFAIAANGAALPQRLGFQCLCECPPPSAPSPSGLRKVAAGETFTMDWEALTLTTCTRSIDCASMGWPGLGTASEIFASAALPSPGAYTATVAVATKVPDGCNSNDGVTFFCSSSFNGSGPGGGTMPSVIQQICPSTATASAPFTLPASGSVDVAISITQ